ncbi:xylulokinase [Alicyclobacillus macrosporangiidus]|uniref:Xylulose kinase n=1 Tax=Alicyclobacillus macrosporangiidus TaxID=392015 RepID=A0A1I7GB28_9BACL|nr:xylulokinase [Alicyclobacillus macrosporangiidus]SFU45456.1 xylulokinase [Alicyclobacillus macrosporangiidus]
MTVTTSAVIGIDVGTSAVKTVAVAYNGRVLGSASVGFPLSSPRSGWAEQDPEDWWQATVQALRDLLQRLQRDGTALDVTGIALTGQMHGLVLLDADGAVIRPAILWCDVRTADEARQLEREIGKDAIIRWTQNPPLPNFTLTKLMWVRSHEPEAYRRTQVILNPKDYVRFRLTGTLCAEYSDASGTLLLDVEKRRWSSELCKAVGVPEAWLPPLTESTDVVGRLTAEAADAVGLPAGVPVVAGAGDQAAGAVGLGVHDPGVVSVIFGTSGVVLAPTDVPVRDAAGCLHTFCHGLPNRWFVMGVTQSAGGSLQWLRDRLFPDESYDSLMERAAGVSPGAEGLTFLPYLMGERTPHLDPYARGVWIGMDWRHGPGHLARSVIEGVAFSLYDAWRVMETLGVPARVFRVSGGGARSELWMRIFASVLGRSLEVVHASHGPAFGAAVLAALGTGQTIDDAWWGGGTSVSPVKDWETVYAKRHALYAETYRRLRDLFPALADDAP